MGIYKIGQVVREYGLKGEKELENRHLFFILQMLIELKHFFWYVDCDLTCDDYFSLHH